MDTLATMPQQMLEDGQTSLADGMIGMRRMVERQKHLMKNLNEEIAEYKANETQLRGSITFLTEENLLLKKGREQIEEDMKNEQDELNKKISKLDQDCRWEKATVVKLEKKLETTEIWFRDTVKHMEGEIATLKVKLRAAELQVKEAQTERNTTKEELTRVQDRTRKLLNSLDLNNDVFKTALSVDHARNISYARRRNLKHNTISMSSNTLTATDQPLLYSRKTNGSTSVALPSDNTEVSNATTTSMELSNKPETEIEATEAGNNKIEDFINESKTMEKNLITDSTPKQNPKSQLQCVTCGKHYDEISNFEGACLSHQPGACLLNEGTSLEVWSCCKSAETFKGCVKFRHISKD